MLRIRNEADKKYIERRTRKKKEECAQRDDYRTKFCRRKKRKYENDKLIKIERDFREETNRNAH